MDFIKLAQDAIEGNCDPLQAYVALKHIEDQLKKALEGVKPLAIAEADKYPGKQIDLADATIEKKSGPAQWKYSHIQAWNNAKAALDYVQKIAQAGGGISPHGEEIGPAVKIEGAATIAVTLKKQGA